MKHFLIIIITPRIPRAARVLVPAASCLVASFVVTLSILRCTPTAIAQMPDPRRVYLDAALKEWTAEELRDGYDGLVAKANLAQIKSLQLDDNLSLSLRAAWEQVRRTIKLEKGEQEVRVDTPQLNWFLGFLEGRLRIGTPDWWREMLLKARARRPDNVVFALPSKPRYHETAFDLSSPRDTVLQKLNANVVLHAGTETCKMPESLLVELRDKTGAEYITAAFSSGVCYFALYSDWTTPYSLVCLDRASSRSRWTARVWADGGLVRYTGMRPHRACGLHWVSIHCQQRRVVLFGGGGHTVYVEAFDPKDGKVLLRFSTAY
jgi:hypothetical protein